jgi:uncharacterized protein
MSVCTIKVLELDGGGERGYLSTQWFSLFLNRWGIDVNTIWKQFDIICGTSIGGIAALGYAMGFPPSVLNTFFTVQGPWIFTIRGALDFNPCIAGNPSNTPNSAQKVAFILDNQPFYQTNTSCTGEANYGSYLLYKTLADTFGTNTLQNVKTNVLIPSYEVTDPSFGYGKGTFTLFSNLTMPYFTGENELITNVAKATSAAPVYLPAAVFNNKTYLDGGLYCNNPAQLGLSTMQAVKPMANRFCVLSIGTGLGTMQFSPDTSVAPGFDTIKNIFSLFDIASTGAQEAVNVGLQTVASNTLNNLYYYRFQPTLDPDKDTALDNTSPEILQYYREVAAADFAENINAIDNFIGHLMA